MAVNNKEKITYKDETQRSRGKFKPALDLSVDEVKLVLLQKIDEETSKIIEDENDFELIKNVSYKRDKINTVSLFSGAGGLDLGAELAGLVATIGYESAMNAFNSD
ncbi:MAG TPA: DNA (cytosine-5-)-methyltransferase, partial [Lysinibacillus sp.]|nr:DNA (cytosine-5-)-methyltransferase [Lysinibacillus sp.]